MFQLKSHPQRSHEYCREVSRLLIYKRHNINMISRNKTGCIVCYHIYMLQCCNWYHCNWSSVFLNHPHSHLNSENSIHKIAAEFLVFLLFLQQSQQSVAMSTAEPCILSWTTQNKNPVTLRKSSDKKFFRVGGSVHGIWINSVPTAENNKNIPQISCQWWMHIERWNKVQ